MSRPIPPSSYQGSAAASAGPSPSATATPASPSSPTTITLDASGSTGLGTLAYAWTLYGPNGVATSKLSSATAVAPTFLPDLEGGWFAVVAVTDSVGTATASVVIQVGAAPRAGTPYHVALNRVAVPAYAVVFPSMYVTPDATVV